MLPFIVPAGKIQILSIHKYYNCLITRVLLTNVLFSLLLACQTALKEVSEESETLRREVMLGERQPPVLLGETFTWCLCYFKVTGADSCGADSCRCKRKTGGGGEQGRCIQKHHSILNPSLLRLHPGISPACACNTRGYSYNPGA